MITIGTVYYDYLAGVNPPPWARCYNPEWVDRLYRGISRNFKEEFRFVCLTHVPKGEFKEDIIVQPLNMQRWNIICLQLHAIRAERLVLMGLDTVITGDLTELFSYRGALAVPKDPYLTSSPCNAVVLSTTRPDIASSKAGSDMAAISGFPHEYLDDLFPGQVLSYKAHVKGNGVGDARIVYFHGEPKPHQVYESWVMDNWK